MEPVWKGYGTGMERVWSRLPPNTLQARSSAEADTGEKSIGPEAPEDDGEGIFAPIGKECAFFAFRSDTQSFTGHGRARLHYQISNDLFFSNPFFYIKFALFLI